MTQTLEKKAWHESSQQTILTEKIQTVDKNIWSLGPYAYPSPPVLPILHVITPAGYIFCPQNQQNM
jgi:hypothetical protein